MVLYIIRLATAIYDAVAVNDPEAIVNNGVEPEVPWCGAHRVICIDSRVLYGSKRLIVLSSVHTRGPWLPTYLFYMCKT